MGNITVRKLKIVPVIPATGETNKEAYAFIRDSTHAQYKGLNRAYSYLATAYYLDMDINSEHFKEVRNSLTNSHEIFNDIAFGVGVDSKSAITQKVKKHFKTDFKNGMAKGERSVRNYKRTYPLMTRGRDLKFYYGEDEEIYIKWVNKIVFKVITGRKDKDYIEVMHTLNKVITGEYKVQESSICSKKKQLILNLNLNLGDTKRYSEEATNIMGVDLGINIPAFACLADNTYIKRSFGSKEEFLKVREQFRVRRTRLQKQLQLSKGGKGRADKLKAMDRFRDSESNFAKSYNHTLSSKIIDFAKANLVGQINLEKLEKDGFDSKLLGFWSYSKLQEMIQYKADREGIVVKFVNSAYTSQQCSKCGHTDKENRQTQQSFICVSCGFKLNADHNAAINIARSTDYKK